MTDTIAERARLQKEFAGVFGQSNFLKTGVHDAFGLVKLPYHGGVYYDVTAFYAIPEIHSGDTNFYVYAKFKNETKPRRFQYHNGGIKLTEEQIDAAVNNDVLRTMIDHALTVEERALETRIEEYAIGYRSEKELVSAMNAQGTANSSIIDPADCCPTPGNANAGANALGTVNWSGAGQTERNIESTVGVAIRGLGSKVLDTVTGETILKGDGTDTYDMWVHPTFKHVLDTVCDLLDTGEHDSIPYTQRLKTSWNVTVRATMQVDAYAGAVDETAVFVLTANTKTNFYIVDVVTATWKDWKNIDNGSVEEWVKRFKVGEGSIAKAYLTPAGQAYKAMYMVTSTPIGA